MVIFAPFVHPAVFVRMEEVRRRAQALLSSSGSAQEVKAQVQVLAGMSLPLSEKYQLLRAEVMLQENTAGCSKQEVCAPPVTPQKYCLKD